MSKLCEQEPIFGHGYSINEAYKEEIDKFGIIIGVLEFCFVAVTTIYLVL